MSMHGHSTTATGRRVGGSGGSRPRSAPRCPRATLLRSQPSRAVRVLFRPSFQCRHGISEQGVRANSRQLSRGLSSCLGWRLSLHLIVRRSKENVIGRLIAPLADSAPESPVPGRQLLFSPPQPVCQRPRFAGTAFLFVVAAQTVSHARIRDRIFIPLVADDPAPETPNKACERTAAS